MVEFLAALFMFLAVVAGAIWLFAPRQGRQGEIRVRELRPAESSDAADSKAPTSKRTRPSIPSFQRLLNNSDWANSTARSLERAHIHLRVGEYLLVRIALTLAAFGIVALILQFSTWGIVLGVMASVVAFILPPVYVRNIQGRRTARIERQLIDFLPSLASSLRAGFAFQQGVEASLKQVGDPLQQELRLLVSDVDIGATMQQALIDMGRRIGSTEVDMMVTAILVQRTTGGNLSEVLDQVADTLRERERIRGEIQTLTASQRMTGLILSVYPIGIGLLLLAVMPDLWGEMFTTTVGIVLLCFAFGLQLLGFLLIRRTLDIEI